VYKDSTSFIFGYLDYFDSEYLHCNVS